MSEPRPSVEKCPFTRDDFHKMIMSDWAADEPHYQFDKWHVNYWPAGHIIATVVHGFSTEQTAIEWAESHYTGPSPYKIFKSLSLAESLEKHIKYRMAQEISVSLDTLRKWQQNPDLITDMIKRRTGPSGIVKRYIKWYQKAYGE